MKDKPVILVVDDQPQGIELLEAHLVPQGYEIVKAASGEEALGKLSSNHIDLILLDVLMPGMDGFEVTRRIRRDTAHRLIPIILITSLQETEDRVKGIEAGCDDFLTKPLDKMELFARVRSLLQVKAYNDLMRDYQIELEAMVTSRTEELRHALENLQQEITERKQAEEVLRDSEEKYRNLFENANEAIFVAQDQKLVFFNPKTMAMLGYSDEELRSRPFIEFIHPDDRDMVLDRHVRRLKGEKLPHLYSFRIFHKDGSIRWGELNAVLINWNGKSSATLNFLSDITERKQAEKALGESEEKYRLLFNTFPLGITVSDPSGNIVESNARAAELLGIPKDKHEARRIDGDQWRIIRPDGTPMPAEEYASVRALKENRVIENAEMGIAKPEAEITWINVIAAPLLLENYGVVITYNDITERKRAEDALRHSEKFLRQVIDASPNCIFIKDWDGRYLLVNKAIAKLYGISKEKMLGRTDFDLAWTGSLDPEEAEKFLADDQDVIKRKTLKRISEECLTRGDGTQDWFHTIKVPLSSDLMPNCMLGVATEITERKQAGEALEAQRAQLKSLFDYSGEAIVLLDIENHILDANSGFERTFGYSTEEARGKLIEALICPERFRDTESKELDEQALEGIKGVEIIRKRKDGEEIDVRVSAGPIKIGDNVTGRFVVFDDITERKQMEEEKSSLEGQLRQSQKLEAVGRLSAGIAHDFNNLLTSIIGNADLTLGDTGKDDPRREMIEEIKEAGQRASGLTQQLLAFSRKQILQPEVTDLNQIVNDVEKMLRRVIGEDIELTTEPARDLGQVEVDVGQMEQVIMNLCINARDAMPKGGKLTIETKNVDLDESYANAHIAVRPGPYVMLAVSDTGIGMTKEIQSRLFEPFFTTKEKGKGTGLGLPTVYGIVKQSNGNIWAYSEPGKGTTFKIYFPRSEETAMTRKEAEGGEEVLQGTETVLVVEDEEMVRNVAVKALKRYGYHVMWAPDGQKALHILQEHHDTIHLMLTDVVMPGMSGRDLGVQAQELLGGLKVVYMSGYTDNAIVHHGVIDKGVRFLQKPFTPDRLAKKVREVLDG